MTKKKKVIIIIAVVLVVLVAIITISLSGNSNDNYYDNNDSESVSDSYYETTEKETTTSLHKQEVPEGYIGIYTVEDFEYIRTNPSYSYILMNDIDFTGVSEWKAPNIENIFDGNNYTINNFNSNCGLFDSCIDGTIKDLSINNANIYRIEDHPYGNPVEIGGICDHLTCGKLLNCNFNGNITVKNLAGTCDVGGIVGKGGRFNHNDSEIINCLFNGDITVYCKFKDDYDSDIGGIAGNTAGTIQSCEATGNIFVSEINTKLSQIVNIGGIVGFSNDDNLGIFNSVNRINISCSKNISCYAGGIIGISDGADIEMCCNYGNIDVNGLAGGINGDNDVLYLPSIVNCYNAGNVTATSAGGISCCGAALTWCYNVGTITGTEKAGNLLAKKYENIKYCYYLDNGTPVTGEGGAYPYVKALSDTEMQEESSYENFPFQYVWKMGDENYPYPVFRY